MSKIIERAIRTPSRLQYAASFALAFVEEERRRLDGEDKLFHDELQKRAPENREDLLSALCENRVARDKLETGWAASSLHRRISASEPAEQSSSAEPLVEERVSAVADAVMSAPRVSGAKAGARLQGYAALFDSDSVDMGYIERVRCGAFAQAIQKSDTRFLFNHDSNFILGRSANKSLRLSEDSKGLHFDCALLDGDSLSDSIVRRVSRGDLSQCSFAFTTKRDSWEFAARPGGIDLRYVEEVDYLYDVSVVTRPAYPSTSVTVLTAPTRGVFDVKRELAVAQVLFKEEKEAWDRTNKAEESLRELDYRQLCRSMNENEKKLVKWSDERRRKEDYDYLVRNKAVIARYS
jgi:hypothetical protein